MYEILKLSGALLALCGIVGLWITIAAQGRCRYCGAKNSPIVYHGRRMCLECYREHHSPLAVAGAEASAEHARVPKRTRPGT